MFDHICGYVQINLILNDYYVTKQPFLTLSFPFGVMSNSRSNRISSLLGRNPTQSSIILAPFTNKIIFVK